jgi:hypothetical protein
MLSESSLRDMLTTTVASVTGPAGQGQLGATSNRTDTLVF